eukprot:TRINITY_DN3294_c0_g1_i6.p1 TRINITY_DN3294_c0_g1~~TRINITY_DN3294_c0_g1_i6.p1  ORF type:complete len:146 (-),score=7.65 TRINITY_DN3294_c0_g1_i6:183-620(-)
MLSALTNPSGLIAVLLLFVIKTDCIISESYILMDLYTSSNGPYWKNSSGWINGTDPCSGWVGISCTLGYVSYINLVTWNISGTLPDSFGSLKNLILLDISDNKLSGTIPTSIFSLTTLNFLSLFGNQLSGTIPPQINQSVSLNRM